ncbi:DUF721 domain-containing protein [Bartonella apis]|uniref:DUF721 domain-containing protein n=1 Tax=Bartonella apis TaxID=1686310 RepID=UPI0026EAF81C|nr:DciA family protein [Bartonella apis]
MMGWKPKKRHFSSLAETASGLLEPLLRKKTGLSLELMANWATLVGEDIAKTTIPLKIIWSRRASIDDPFKPGTLVVGCEAYSAMILTHETGEILQRINAFFGYVAINRIKIEQRVIVKEEEARIERPPVNETDRKLIDELTGKIENDGLRNSLSDLGLSIFSQKYVSHGKKFNN